MKKLAFSALEALNGSPRQGWYLVANQDYNKYILESYFLFSVFWPLEEAH